MSTSTERLRILGTAAAILLAGVCTATAAAAEEGAELAESAPAIPGDPRVGATPAAAPGPNERAAQFFHDAEARYQAGDLPGAHRLMLAAYELSGRFELLFNLGQLERERQRCPEARRYYEAYLAQAPAGERRTQAQRYQLMLARECPEQRPTPPVLSLVHPPPLNDTSQVRPLQLLGWSSLGTSLVTGVAAAYFALESARHEDRLEARIRSAQSPDGQARGFTRADKDLEANGRRAANWARGLTASAVGLAAVGVSLLVIDSRAAASGTTSFSVDWRAGAARAEYSTSF